MSRVKLPERERRRVFNKTGGICYLCDEPIDYSLPKTSSKHFQVDHMVPLAAGGPEHFDNYWPSHADCNKDKTDLPVDVAMAAQREKKYTSRTW